MSQRPWRLIPLGRCIPRCRALARQTRATPVAQLFPRPLALPTSWSSPGRRLQRPWHVYTRPLHSTNQHLHQSDYPNARGMLSTRPLDVYCSHFQILGCDNSLPLKKFRPQNSLSYNKMVTFPFLSCILFLLFYVMHYQFY